MSAPTELPVELPRETRPTPRPESERPILLLFASGTSGQSRRVEGFVAHVLQRRHNHDTFRFRIVLQERRPDLFERFHIDNVPSLVVIDDKRVKARLSGYVRPHQVEDLLRPWLH